MENQQAIQELIKEIRGLAQTKTMEEQVIASGEEFFNPADMGNYDDVYTTGINDGRIEYAREVLDLIEKL